MGETVEPFRSERVREKKEEKLEEKKEDTEEVDIYATFVAVVEPCEAPFGTFVANLNSSSTTVEENIEGKEEKGKGPTLNYREPESWEVGLVALNEGKFDSEHMSEEVTLVFFVVFSFSTVL